MPDVLLSEFFDNSLFAGAQSASISIDEDAEGQPCLRIKDNGVSSITLIWLSAEQHQMQHSVVARTELHLLHASEVLRSAIAAVD
jgi:hypothetical protein